MKKILLIATGGTIAASGTGKGLYPILAPEKLITLAGRAPYEIDSIQPMNIDSTNIQPEDWTVLSAIIQKNYNDYDGFVITHGTDTLAYSAAMLSYLVRNSHKPVVLTGSQRPADFPGSDAPRNLHDSFLYASEGIPGIFVVFNGKVIYGTRSRKLRSKSFEAFESINHPLAGVIENDRIRYICKPAAPAEKPRFYTELYPHVFLLKLAPGMQPGVLDYISDIYEGIVIESYGTGGIPFADKRNFLEKLKNATQKGKIIVMATQVMLEGSNLEMYEVGARVLQYNVLQAYDMTIEAAVTKLMWILSVTKEYDKAAFMFHSQIHKDITLGPGAKAC